jgi:hypothetical protein
MAGGTFVPTESLMTGVTNGLTFEGVLSKERSCEQSE